MKSGIFGILIFVMQLAWGSTLCAETVMVYGLEAMPFCGTVDGQITGIAVNILNEATKYGAPNFTFKLDVPWKRAQMEIQKANTELVAIIPFSRIKEREDKYKWVSELARTQYRFYSYGRSAPIQSIDETKNERVGVVFGHAIIPVLEELGLQDLDTGARNAEHNAHKLLMKRANIIADADIICLYNWKKIGQDKKDLQEGPAIKDATGVYIAAGLGFPDDVASKISNAIDKMRDDGSLQKIWDKWF